VFDKIEWFNTNGNSLGEGLTYTAQSSDVGYKIYYTVTYPDGSADTSSVDCYSAVLESSLGIWFQLYSSSFDRSTPFAGVIDNTGDMYLAYPYDSSPQFNQPAVSKITNDVNKVWSTALPSPSGASTEFFNSYGSSYNVVESSDTTIDIIRWNWADSTAGPYYIDLPITIIRHRLNKSDGSLVSSAAVEYSFPGATQSDLLYFNIENVKIDENNNYYAVGNFPHPYYSYAPCVISFDENLNYRWSNFFEDKYYRGTGAVCSGTMSDGYASICVSDGNIIGSEWRNSFVKVHSNYFRMDNSGNVVSTFNSKFSTPDFSTDLNPFLVRSVCRDSDGYIYGLGGYDSDTSIGTYSAVVVYKDTPGDSTVWAVDIRDTIKLVAGSMSAFGGNQMLIRNTKLIVVGRVLVGFSGNLLIFVFDKDTGNLEEVKYFIISPDFGSRADIQPLPENNKFIIHSTRGFHIRLDADSLPPDGEYPTPSNPGNKYTVSGLTTITSSHTFYRFTDCKPSFTNPSIGSYFTAVSPTVVASGMTGEVLRYIGGPDYV